MKKQHPTLLVSLAGLALTLIGAAVAAYGVILSDADARALATAKWDFNKELYASLLTQSRCAMWGLIILAAGTFMQIVAMILPRAPGQRLDHSSSPSQMTLSRRGTTSAALGCGLVLSSIAVLAFAAAWQPETAPQCFVDLWHSQFPKWLGCALAVHETLSGGLIAASGALFAGWLAYIVLSDQAAALAEQAAISRADQREARRLALEKLVHDTGGDLGLMVDAKGFTRGIADMFPQTDDPNASASAYSSTLLDLQQQGYLRPSARAVLAPDRNGHSVETVMNRLRDFANNLHERTKDLSSDVKAGELRRQNQSAQEHVNALRQLAALLDGQLPKYRANFEDAVARLNAFQTEADA